jgi:hypothetical protein
MNQPGWGCKIIKSFVAAKLPVKFITGITRKTGLRFTPAFRLGQRNTRETGL